MTLQCAHPKINSKQLVSLDCFPRWSLDRQQGRVTHLLKVAEFLVLAQLLEVVDSLGVVETVVVVDFTVACQLTELRNADM